MNSPTNDDLKRMVDEARAEHNRCGDSPTGLGELVNRAVLTLKLAHTTMLAGSFWRDVRVLALRAMWLCGLLAWEAGKRMVPASYDAVTMGGTPLPGTHPTDPPTAAETPEAKAAPSVEALLEEAETRWPGGFAPFYSGIEMRQISDARFAWYAATALRAERERADFHYRSGTEIAEVYRGLKAKLAAEDQAHVNTQTTLQEALGAQSRAESERDGLRSDLAKMTRELEGARKDRDAAIDQVVAYRAENQALGYRAMTAEHRVEGLEKAIRGLAAHVPAKGEA